MSSFTTEVPGFASNLSKGTDKISFEVKSGRQKVTVEILPDEEGFVETGSAATEISLSSTDTGYEWDGHDKITKLPVYKFLLTIKTTYKPDIDQLSASGYGRGTTKQDKRSKNVSLHFHESQHGLKAIKYITIYPLPVPQLHLHMSKTNLIHHISSFREKFDTYYDTLDRKNKAEVDCVGTLPDKGFSQVLDSICWPATRRKRPK